MFSNLPPVTKALLIANVALFVLQLAVGDGQQLPGEGVLDAFKLWPWGASDDPASSFMPWQLLSYGFLHGGIGHLVFNMLTLVMFGAPIEFVWGNRRFLAYYLVCVAGAGLCQLLIGSWMVMEGERAYATIGASGGVFGLLLAYGLLFPHQRVMLLIPPVPMKARTLVFVVGAVALLLGFTGLQPGVAHFAHLGGMLFGYLLIRYWRGSPPFKGGGRKRPRIVR